MDTKTKDMAFTAALLGVKAGLCAARAGWNGKNMFIYLNPGSVPPGVYGDTVNGVHIGLFEQGAPDTTIRMPNINLQAADGSIVTGWLASQTDMLAEDWQIVTP